jgi:hypothetical protein
MYSIIGTVLWANAFSKAGLVFIGLWLCFHGTAHGVMWIAELATAYAHGANIWKGHDDRQLDAQPASKTTQEEAPND